MDNVRLSFAIGNKEKAELKKTPDNTLIEAEIISPLTFRPFSTFHAENIDVTAIVQFTV